MCLGFRYHLFLAFRLIIHSRILQYHFWFPVRVFLLLFLFISAFCSPRGPQNSASGSRVDSGGPTSFRYTIHNYQTPRYEQLTLTLVSTSSALHCYIYFVRPEKGAFSKKKSFHGEANFWASFHQVSLHLLSLCHLFTILPHKGWPLLCCISHSLCQFLYFMCFSTT